MSYYYAAIKPKHQNLHDNLLQQYRMKKRVIKLTIKSPRTETITPILEESLIFATSNTCLSDLNKNNLLEQSRAEQTPFSSIAMLE